MSLLRSQRLAAALARAGPSSSLSLATTQLRGLAVAGRVVVGGDSSGGTPQRRRAAPKAVLEMTDTAAERIRGLLERRREREPAIAVRVGPDTLRYQDHHLFSAPLHRLSPTSPHRAPLLRSSPLAAAPIAGR